MLTSAKITDVYFVEKLQRTYNEIPSREHQRREEERKENVILSFYVEREEKKYTFLRTLTKITNNSNNRTNDYVKSHNIKMPLKSAWRRKKRLKFKTKEKKWCEFSHNSMKECHWCRYLSSWSAVKTLQRCLWFLFETQFCQYMPTKQFIFQ